MKMRSCNKRVRPPGHNVLDYVRTSEDSTVIKETKPSCSGICMWKRRHIMVQPSQAYNQGKYDNNGKCWYFRFDYDNKMSCRVHISICQCLPSAKSIEYIPYRFTAWSSYFVDIWKGHIKSWAHSFVHFTFFILIGKPQAQPIATFRFILYPCL